MENELHSQQPYSSLQRTAWLYNIEQGDPQTDTPVLHLPMTQQEFIKS